MSVLGKLPRGGAPTAHLRTAQDFQQLCHAKGVAADARNPSANLTRHPQVYLSLAVSLTVYILVGAIKDLG